MTQDEFTLFTGQSVNYSDDDWETLVNVAEARLASFLCLDEFPEEPDDALVMLLANFMAAVIAHQGDTGEQIESKSVRNFTVRFATEKAANVFAILARNYGDIIDNYSKCGGTLKVERSVNHYGDKQFYGF